MTTTAIEEPRAADQPQPDPYRYGWRYVRRELPNGVVDFEQAPLTLEDVLYPEVGDFIVHSKAHEDLCRYLADVFGARLRGNSGGVVLHDVRVAWDVPELRPNGPDITVILGVREQRNWSTFDVAEEGVRPALVIEVTSPETRQLDLIDKVEIYGQAGVALYLIVDTRRWRGEHRLHVIAHRLTPDGYEVLPPDERGWFWLEPVGLWIGIRDNQVECYDETGTPVGDYTQIDLARADAEARAQTAEARAQTAETQAQAEIQARTQAEARLRELEAELRRLRGEGS
jgi:Uma2 family endonuclease